MCVHVLYATTGPSFTHASFMVYDFSLLFSPILTVHLPAPVFESMICLDKLLRCLTLHNYVNWLSEGTGVDDRQALVLPRDFSIERIGVDPFFSFLSLKLIIDLSSRAHKGRSFFNLLPRFALYDARARSSE